MATTTTRADDPQLGVGTGKSEEEGLAKYCPGGFHPVRLGEIYANKYRVLRKLGYGQYSTVWLVRNIQNERHWAMKVLSAECYGTDADIYELDILKHLQKAKDSHGGSRFIAMLEDSFEHEGPNANHVCLIFKIMAESLMTFPGWFDDGGIPAPLVQHFTKQLLKAVDFAHRRGVIHTDIKQSNIMVQIPDEALLVSSLKESDEQSQNLEKATVEDDKDDEYAVIPSRGLREDYLEEGFNLMELNVALADWGVATWSDRHLTEHIQPTLLRAPEVLLEAPWDQAVDIWNLGALVPELVFGQCMFDGSSTGRYEVKNHLEEMNALLGPFPESLLNEAGVEEARDLFDGDGNVKDPVLKSVVSLEQRFEALEDEERAKFVGFVRAMLELDPKKRSLLRSCWRRTNGSIMNMEKTIVKRNKITTLRHIWQSTFQPSPQ